MWEPLSDLSGSEHSHPSPGESAFTTGLVAGGSSAFLHVICTLGLISPALFKRACFLLRLQSFQIH